MNPKALRGLRRHWRRHQRWATHPAPLDLAALTRFQVATAPLGLAPWFTQQKPPQQFRQLWVARLVSDLPT